MKKILDLTFTFFRVGCVMFGGGYVMLPLLQREVVEKRGWVSEEELLDCFAISQCTPGVIAVNTATFVGYKRASFVGGFFATIGVVLPSLIIISILAGILQQVSHYAAVINAFAGVRAVVAALVLSALWKLYRTGVKGAFGNGLCVAALILAVIGISPVWIVVGAIVIGVVMELARRKKA